MGYISGFHFPAKRQQIKLDTGNPHFTIKLNVSNLNCFYEKNVQTLEMFDTVIIKCLNSITVFML